MIEYALLTFGSLFAIVDPFACIPAFLAMTARDTIAARRRMALVACATSGLVMAVFAALGPAVFRFFGITLPAFQIAGGLIMLLSALDMLRARRSPLKETAEETEEGVHKDDVAITPLAIPMLSGPGAITTAIVLNGQAGTWAHRAALYGCIALVAALSYLVLRAAAALPEVGASAGKGLLGAILRLPLSPTAMNVLSRLMGLLLAAIGIQFILTALRFSQ